jgi:hypothetical protein
MYFGSTEHKICIWCQQRISTLLVYIVTGAQEDAVVYNGYLLKKCKLWDEPSCNFVITINNANNTPTILCNSLRNAVISKLPLSDYKTLTFLCEFLGRRKL